MDLTSPVQPKSAFGNDARTGPSTSHGPGTEPDAIDARFHLAAIVESSDDPIISKDLSGTITSWNNAATRVFGYEPEEIMGQSILRLIPPELQHEEGRNLETLRAGQRIEHFETTRLRKNGERFPVSITISPIKDAEGRIVGSSRIVRDISRRVKSDESQFRLAAIVDSADDAIVSKDLNGIVKTWNFAATRIFGYTAEEMVGQSILKLIPENLKYEEDEILRKLRAGERIDHYETTRRRKNGELFDVPVTISPIRDDTGRVIGASKIARDISRRKQFEMLLIQSEKIAATGRMAAAVAHEINNPLESLINLIFLARQDSPEGSKAHKLLLTAEEELERVSHIARQTLGYYRETGTPAEVFLHDLIENVLVVYNSKIISNGISVAANFNDLQRITVSKGELLQVFSNVIANAIDAMNTGGTLDISTRNFVGPSGPGIQIVISDTGLGIQAEHLPRVFEPFFTTKGNMGTGLGLWVARQLVESRGGQISIASNNGKKNSGTVVTIFVPFARPQSNISREQENGSRLSIDPGVA
jgi:PAS domain S-box-containing protein